MHVLLWARGSGGVLPVHLRSNFLTGSKRQEAIQIAFSIITVLNCHLCKVSISAECQKRTNDSSVGWIQKICDSFTS